MKTNPGARASGRSSARRLHGRGGAVARPPGRHHVGSRYRTGDGAHAQRGGRALTADPDRVVAILRDIGRFAITARRVAARGHVRFVDTEDDDQRRIARSLVVDLSAAADRLPEEFRLAHPEVDWRGIRATRHFVAHDDGTDDEILWRAVAAQFRRIVAALDAG